MRSADHPLSLPLWNGGARQSILDADQVAVEIAILKLQLEEEESNWAAWREGHKLTSDPRGDGPRHLRDRIFFLEAKLSRTKL